MATTYIVFDTRSGQILGVHQGARDAAHARRGTQLLAQRHGQRQAATGDQYLGVIEVATDAVETGKRYKVDVGSKALVATEGADGIGFSSGSAGRST